MLDRLAEALFDDGDPAAVLHDKLSQELVVGHHSARLRLDLPFAERGDVSLKKIGLELIVRVDGQKRTIMLPPGLAGFRPREAKLEEGALQVTFEGPDG
jgi:arsenite-transporting ATPase